MAYMSIYASRKGRAAPGVGMQGYSRAPSSMNSAHLKQYSDFGIILRKFSMRSELLNIYPLLSGRGVLAAVCGAAQGERATVLPHPGDAPCLEAAGVRRAMESNVLQDGYLVLDVKWKDHLG